MSPPRLSDLVRRAWARARTQPILGTSDAPVALQAAATVVAMTEFGVDAVIRAPGLLNCAAAAVLSRSRLEITEVSPGAAHLIADTDLRALPTQAPALLSRVLLLEASKGARAPLWPPSATSVLCYPYTALDGREGYYVAKLTTADRFVGGFWYPRWKGESFADSVPVEVFIGEMEAGESPDRSGYPKSSPAITQEIARIAQYVLTLAILWDARDTPLRIEGDAAPAPSRPTRRPPPPPTACATVRRVTLRPLDAPRGEPAPSVGTANERAVGDAAPERANHRTTSIESRVRHHLQRYHCGPQGERTEYRFKAAKTALRWASERVTTHVGVAR